MRRIRWDLIAAVLLAPTTGDAQGAKVFCIPNTQACFSATMGFIPNPTNPFYKNRLTSVITNLQGTYGGLNAPFGFLGLGFVSRWNAAVDPRATLGWFDLPSETGRLRANERAPGFDFDQPTGGNGYMLMRGTGYLGCQSFPGDGSWTYAGCAADGRDGGVHFGLDLARVGREGNFGPASFRHFALRAVTTAGSCTFTPSTWLLERSNDACEERTMSAMDGLSGATVTPEPASLALLASGLAGIALGAHRKRRRTGADASTRV